MSKLVVLFEKPSEHQSLQIFIFLIGFILGWLGTHYVIALLYPITGPICIFGFHFHHLYLGLILLAIGLVFYYPQRFQKYHSWILFFIAFSIGMVFDDIMDHFILQIDPFEWWC